MRRCYLSCIVLLLMAARAGAQVIDEPLFNHISLEQGLSDGRVTAIAQDKYGFMWIGTAAGLNRYDGYNFRVYSEGDSGLAGNNISALYAAKSGQLYVGDGAGLLRYDFTTNRFERPPGTDSSELNQKRYTVTLMTEDAAGRIYIGCTEGLFRYTPRASLLEDMNKLIPLKGRIKHVSGLTFGRDGRLWITTQKQGFFGINPANNTYVEVPHDRQYGHDTGFYAIHRTLFLNDSLLLVGQHSYALTILNTRSLKFTAQKGALGRNDSIRFNAVYRLIQDYKGRVWGGTAYHGLIQYHPQTKDVTVYRADPFNPYSYDGYRVFALCEDREHNIWVGTGGYGVYWFNPDKATVRYFPWNPVSRRSPPGPEVLSAAIRDSHSMWIGTDKGPAAFFPETAEFRPYKYENSYNPSLPGSNITFIYPARDGSVWFSTRHLGISRYDERSGRSVRFLKQDETLHTLIGKPDKSPIPANNINDISEDPDGRMLLTILGRLAIFDVAKRASKYGTKDSSDSLLRLKAITDILRVGQTLYIGLKADGATKLLGYDFTTKSLTTLAVLDTAGKTRINMLQAMPDGDIAVASSAGIYIVRKSGGVAYHYRYNRDERHNNIIGLVADDMYNIWVCTDRSIGKLNLHSSGWLWLGAGDGVKPTRFFGDAFKRMPDGRIMAGSGDGIFVIKPGAVQAAPARAPALVDFRVFGKAVLLQTPLQEAEQIELTHEQNFFSFAMSTLQYGGSGGTEYGYKLQGYDKDWQNAGSERAGQYTGVSGGKYTLLLRARSAGGDWVTSPKGIRIIVGKAWWETWGFRVLALLLLVCGVLAIYLNRVRGIRRAASLRTEYEIRLNELEMSALRTQMNPHFIFNCLNTINSYINSNQKAQANHYITRFARLIRLILENSRQRRIPLSKELEALRLYVELEALRFEGRFTYNFHIDDSLDEDNVEVPPLILQPFVENAILHGILPGGKQGAISVRVQQRDGKLVYEVEDNGIGRAAAAKLSAESALKKESHGMAITGKRIELFNREHGMEGAAVRVEDLAHDGQAAGTRVTIPLAFVEAF